MKATKFYLFIMYLTQLSCLLILSLFYSLRAYVLTHLTDVLGTQTGNKIYRAIVSDTYIINSPCEKIEGLDKLLELLKISVWLEFFIIILLIYTILIFLFITIAKKTKLNLNWTRNFPLGLKLKNLIKYIHKS